MSEESSLERFRETLTRDFQSIVERRAYRLFSQLAAYQKVNGYGMRVHDSLALYILESNGLIEYVPGGFRDAFVFGVNRKAVLTPRGLEAA